MQFGDYWDIKHSQWNNLLTIISSHTETPSKILHLLLFDFIPPTSSSFYSSPPSERSQNPSKTISPRKIQCRIVSHSNITWSRSNRGIPEWPSNLPLDINPSQCSQRDPRKFMECLEGSWRIGVGWGSLSSLLLFSSWDFFSQYSSYLFLSSSLVAKQQLRTNQQFRLLPHNFLKNLKRKSMRKNPRV